MKALDFEYDGLCLSDWGYIVCKFDDTGGLETITNGSQLTFNTVPQLDGSKFNLVDTKYEECIESTFQICKNVCDGGLQEISMGEYRDLVSWLNRREFHKFKILDPEFLDFYYMGSFNVSRLEIAGTLYGLEIVLKTDRPFAVHEDIVLNIKNTEYNGTYTIIDSSDDDGYTYPVTEILCRASGDLTIYNSRENRTTSIRNCSAGEKITLNYPIVESSYGSHKIQDDFNFVFLRLASDFHSKENKLTFSMPCDVKLKYNPVVKVGLW